MSQCPNSLDNCNYEKPVVKQEIVDPENFSADSAPSIYVLNCIKQEFQTINKEADCKIAKFLVTENGGCARVEVFQNVSDQKPTQGVLTNVRNVTNGSLDQSLEYVN